MKTKQKLINVAKRYLVDDESITYVNQFGEAVTLYQKNGEFKIKEQVVK